MPLRPTLVITGSGSAKKTDWTGDPYRPVVFDVAFAMHPLRADR